MRNEIFNRIEQNKIRYYSQLKNEKIVAKRYQINSASKYDLNTENAEKSVHQTSWTRIFVSANNILHENVVCELHIRFTKLISFTTGLIVKNYSYINQKANQQSKRFKDKLTAISLQLFEDNYEYSEKSDAYGKKTPLSEFSNKKSDPLNTSIAGFAIPFDVVNQSLQEKLHNWLNKIYLRLAVFLESDDWFDEINRSFVSSFSSGETCKGVKINFSDSSPVRYMNNNLARFLLKVKAFNKINMRLSDQNRIKKALWYLKTYNPLKIDHIKGLCINLFPAINRFIF